MPCGKKPLVKKWDKPKEILTVKPSRYQKNEASVKLHWQRVLTDLELLYKDDKFWETQSSLVRELVGEVIYERLIKIFDLPKDKILYEPPDEDVEVEPSEAYYTFDHEEFQSQSQVAPSLLSISNVSEEAGEELEEEQSEEWSSSSLDLPRGASRSKPQSSRSAIDATSSNVNIEFSKSKQLLSKTMFSKVFSQRFGSKSKTIISESSQEETSSDDDIKVHADSLDVKKRNKRGMNHHFELLYCNESETDMIKWNSNYKQKKFEISASDEFSKKAQIVTKEIAYKFFAYWTSVGSPDYKTEIKRPEDIEDLFQVWFDEHASRGLILEPKIMPCVLESIAKHVRVPDAACSKVLERQIAFDIHAETSPKHTRAFNTSLPKHMRHLPPKNNTKETWKPVDIPEDLRTMACIFAETSHLTSIKSFREWLQQRSHLTMPTYFRELETTQKKKQLFVKPSGIYVRGSTSFTEASSVSDFILPVSQFSLETKEVLSKLLRD